MSSFNSNIRSNNNSKSNLNASTNLNTNPNPNSNRNSSLESQKKTSSSSNSRGSSAGSSNVNVSGPNTGVNNAGSPNLGGSNVSNTSVNLNKSMIMCAQGIHKMYVQGSGKLHILKGVDLNIYENEALCIVGSSGAGKSTLIHILGALDSPDEGKVLFKNKDLFQLNDEELADYRNRSLGFVFQAHHLLAEFNALENVMLPARLRGATSLEVTSKAEALLEKVGLRDRMDHFPNQLSGGELQRVAIARALVNDPEILFADEPTGNLDSQNGKMIQDLFFDLITQMKLTLVVVTHDLKFSERFPRVLRMQDGRWVLQHQGKPSK